MLKQICKKMKKCQIKFYICKKIWGEGVFLTSFIVKLSSAFWTSSLFF